MWQARPGREYADSATGAAGLEAVYTQGGQGWQHPPAAAVGSALISYLHHTEAKPKASSKQLNSCMIYKPSDLPVLPTIIFKSLQSCTTITDTQS